MPERPDACTACPWASHGRGFVPDSGQGEVLLLLPGPSLSDLRGESVTGYTGSHAQTVSVPPAPLLGGSGYTWEQTYAPLAGLTRAQVHCRSVIRCVSKDPPSWAAMDYCRIHDHPITPTHVIAMGKDPWRLTQGADLPLTDWRGFEGPHRYAGAPVFGVFHPTELAKEPTRRLIARRDWQRIGRWRDGTWPRPIPQPLRVGWQPDAEILAAFASARQAAFVTIDTEYTRDTKLLTLCGLAWPTITGIQGLQIEWLQSDVTTAQRRLFKQQLAQLVRHVPVVFWNAKADVPVLAQHLDIPITHYAQLDDAMQAHAVLWSELPHTYEFAASLYGQHPKLKHLGATDALLYNWGDVLELIPIWQALQRELAEDPQSAQVYRTQQLPMLAITLAREQQGLRVNTPMVNQLLATLQARLADIQAMVTAYCGYPLNIGSPGIRGQLAQYLRHVEGLSLEAVDQNTIAEARSQYLPVDTDREERQGLDVAYLLDRIAQGAHPLLELRAGYAATLQMESHYIRPLVGQTRCYPQIHIHTQASGRHSTVQPPLAQFPEALLPLVIPDPGHLWWGGDYEAQEPRLLMGYSRSRALRAAFEEGRDIHTEFVCQIYGWTTPPAGFTKADARRVFAKQARYEIWYLGTGRVAVDNAVRLGAERRLLERALVTLRNSDPDILAYQRRMRQDIMQTHMSRTWAGRRRVYTAGARTNREREDMIRCLYNHRNQGGGVDLYNLVIVEMHHRLPDVPWQYGRHDSLWFGMPVADATPARLQQMKAIIEQPRDIDGVSVSFPMSYKIMDETGQTWAEAAWLAAHTKETR